MLLLARQSMSVNMQGAIGYLDVRACVEENEVAAVLILPMYIAVPSRCIYLCKAILQQVMRQAPQGRASLSLQMMSYTLHKEIDITLLDALSYCLPWLSHAAQHVLAQLPAAIPCQGLRGGSLIDSISYIIQLVCPDPRAKDDTRQQAIVSGSRQRTCSLFIPRYTSHGGSWSIGPCPLCCRTLLVTLPPLLLGRLPRPGLVGSTASAALRSRFTTSPRSR